MIARHRPLSSVGLAVFLAVSVLQETLNPKVEVRLPARARSCGSGGAARVLDPDVLIGPHRVAGVGLDKRQVVRLGSARRVAELTQEGTSERSEVQAK